MDESMRGAESRATYLVSAVIVSDKDSVAIEGCLRSLAGRSRRRVHWHHEGERVRFGLMDVLAGLPLRGVTVAVEHATTRRQEKAREVGLWNLFVQLEAVGVTELVIEARQEQLDRRDRRTIRAIRRAGIGARIRYRFGRPSDDVGLWMADALAGAVGRHLVDGDDRYVNRLPDGLLSVHRVEC